MFGYFIQTTTTKNGWWWWWEMTSESGHFNQDGKEKHKKKEKKEKKRIWAWAMASLVRREKSLSIYLSPTTTTHHLPSRRRCVPLILFKSLLIHFPTLLRRWWCYFCYNDERRRRREGPMILSTERDWNVSRMWWKTGALFIYLFIYFYFFVFFLRPTRSPLHTNYRRISYFPLRLKIFFTILHIFRFIC
jgi:hypothetical protein